MKTAEMIKYVHNLFNATKISLFNEIHSIEKKLGIDSDLVHSIVAKTAEGMWRPEYGIKGGYPYGGSCLPKDTVAFFNFAREHGLGQMPLLRATIEVNSRLLRESLRREEGSAISGR
jgi:UDPglucose 6-dehydrogenase